MQAIDEDARFAFEAKVMRMARQFDVRCLLDLLFAKGYHREDILFEGTHEGASLTLVENVTFRQPPSRGVLITLNLGLLGDNSLLPSYFFAVIEGTPHPERFFDFIRFFDHRLIESLLRAIYPEGDTSLFASWDDTLRAFLKMLGPGSVSTMHWLAQLYFPETRCLRLALGVHRHLRCLLSAHRRVHVGRHRDPGPKLPVGGGWDLPRALRRGRNRCSGAGVAKYRAIST